MAVNTIVREHPERIKDPKRIEDTLADIEAYETMYTCNAGVVLVQNNQLGASYIIVSEEEAQLGIENPGVCERYIKFYHKSHYRRLLQE